MSSRYLRTAATVLPPFRRAPVDSSPAAREVRLRGSSRGSWLVRERRPGETREACLARFDAFWARLDRPAY